MIKFIIYITVMALSVASLNINGLNDTRKQMKVVSLAMYHKIDILMMQDIM